MSSILITGSNRGIGLEFTHQYADAGWRVFATCRHPAEADDLNHLVRGKDNVSLHRLDITRRDSICAIACELRDTPLDILLNNAGVYLESDYLDPELGGIRYDDWLYTLDVNTLGPVRLTEALLSNLKGGSNRLVTTLTSHMGSISDISIPGSYYYRSSKAALNAAMQGLAEALRNHRIGVLLLHPGSVRTRMNPSIESMPPEQSVTGMRQVIHNFDFKETGCFIKYDGTRLPW